MGNQNTSGIVEEEAKNEARDNSIREDRVMVQENEEGDKIPSVERLEFDDKDVEDDKVRVEGSDETDIKTNGSDSGERGPKMSGDEEQDQPCTFTIKEEEMKIQSPECTSHEAESTTSDAQQEQNMVMKEALEASDHDAEMKDGDVASVEGSFLEARPREDNGAPQEEQSNSMNNTIENQENEHVNEYCSSLDHEEKRTIDESAEDEAKNEHPNLDMEEEKPMINESSNDDTNITIFSITICVDQEIECNDPMIEAELKENGDDSLEEDAEKRDENEATDENVLEKTLPLESEPSHTENGHETEMETTEKCITELRSSRIDTEEVETPPISIESVKILETEANQTCNGARVELRKSPSFDFGITFDTRSEDSDQTPLLYQEKTARRSLSTCSNLSFQTQKEYAAKPLQFEAVQVEEKTILMETTPPLSQAKNSQQNGSDASPSKGNGRRKARSSLFTTCICCTAAIS